MESRKKEEATPHAAQLTDFTSIVADVSELKATTMKNHAKLVDKPNMLIIAVQQQPK